MAHPVGSRRNTDDENSPPIDTPTDDKVFQFPNPFVPTDALALPLLADIDALPPDKERFYTACYRGPDKAAQEQAGMPRVRMRRFGHLPGLAWSRPVSLSLAMAISVGVVGGGQLGRMLYQASVDLDIPVSFLVRATDEGVRGTVPRCFVGDLTYDDLRRFAQEVDVVTFEHELTPIPVLERLEHDGVELRPSASVMRTASDKLLQRELFARLGIEHIPFDVLDREHLSALNLPVIAKAAQGGYDGRGVVRATETATLQQLSTTDRVWLIEPVLEVEAELAVLAARSATGELKTYPPVRTVQVDGICVEVYWPSKTASGSLGRQARSIAASIAEELGIVGVLAVEFFVVGGRLVVNEIAPRVHNSGHLTIEASLTSQFENHLRAICAMPLGPTDFQLPVSMVNLIGKIPKTLPQIPARIHLYGKTPRPGRKVGHLTAVGTTIEEARSRAHESRTRCLQ